VQIDRYQEPRKAWFVSAIQLVCDCQTARQSLMAYLLAENWAVVLLKSLDLWCDVLIKQVTSMIGIHHVIQADLSLVTGLW